MISKKRKEILKVKIQSLNLISKINKGALTKIPKNSYTFSTTILLKKGGGRFDILAEFFHKVNPNLPKPFELSSILGECGLCSHTLNAHKIGKITIFSQYNAEFNHLLDEKKCAEFF